MKSIVAFSGGKDSTAMLLRMIELNYQIDEIIFADTTLEYPEMYEWINKIENIIPYKIKKVFPKKSFDAWFYGFAKRGKLKDKNQIRGFPLTVFPCYWTREGKIIPMEKSYGIGNIIYIGIDAGEIKRADGKKYKNSNNKYKFPLIEWGWNGKQCFEYLKSKGLEHPLRFRFKRTGCWLCPKQSINSLKNLYLYYPELWKKLKQYEKDSPQKFKHNFNLNEFEEKIKKEILYKKQQKTIMYFLEKCEQK
jgi:3'-phosphoadenosine 5'-phosphosulfate sulfotransferase (PAPS reductase)/FAD synthetase